MRRLVCLSLFLLGAAAPPPQSGDLPEIQKAGALRFLIPGEMDSLAREGDPRAAEQDLARQLAAKLKLTAVFVPVGEYGELLDALEEGRGDVIVASLAVTPERQARIAFTRPVRYVRQMLVARSGEVGLDKPEDLAGKRVTVRGSSSYAATLRQLALRVPVEVVPAAENASTFDLIAKVARGEEALTVADSDILTVALGFETGVRGAFALTEKDPIAWGLRKKSVKLKAVIDAFLVEKALTGHKEDTYLADLDEIKKRRVLRVLTRNNSTSFFLYRGEQLGFEYELARMLAESLGVRLEIIVPPSRDALLDYLSRGKGDLVAASLSITPEREKSWAFSAPYNTVSELLVVGPSDKTTHALADLRGKKISVRKSSGYYQTLLALQAANGFELELLPEEMETEDILEEVAQGKIGATLADSNIVDVELTYSDQLRVVGPAGDPVHKGWVMRKDQPGLKAAADAWIKKNYRGLLYNVLVTKYFKNQKQMRAASGGGRADLGGQLSPYDALVKKHAKAYEMDWRLVTSQMYQESRFDPATRSWVGALGLMQIMPPTARDLKVTDVMDPEQNIQGGIKLLTRYARMFEGDIKEKDRLRFALAAYNCGPGHVFDARRLAAEGKLDPNKWFGNVEKAMLLLSKPAVARKARFGYCRCEEPVKYVSEIQSRYDAYSKLVAVE